MLAYWQKSTQPWCMPLGCGGATSWILWQGTIENIPIMQPTNGAFGTSNWPSSVRKNVLAFSTAASATVKATRKCLGYLAWLVLSGEVSIESGRRSCQRRVRALDRRNVHQSQWHSMGYRVHQVWRLNGLPAWPGTSNESILHTCQREASTSQCGYTHRCIVARRTVSPSPHSAAEK